MKLLKCNTFIELMSNIMNDRCHLEVSNMSNQNVLKV